MFNCTIIACPPSIRQPQNMSAPLIDPESTTSLQPSADEPPPPPPASSLLQPQQAPPIEFLCHRCGMHQLCNYHGDSPPFAPIVRLPAAFYVKKNPFAPPPSVDRPSAEYYLLLGGDCARCDRPVCRAGTCSIFYAGRTTCLACAQRWLDEFPTEMRSKINRALSECRPPQIDQEKAIV